jgi:hypothetical protein
LKEGERGNKEEGFRLKTGIGQGGMGKMPFFYLPPSLPIQNRGGRVAFGRWWVPTSWGSAAAGEEGKTERTTRGFDSPT